MNTKNWKWKPKLMTAYMYIVYNIQKIYRILFCWFRAIQWILYWLEPAHENLPQFSWIFVFLFVCICVVLCYCCSYYVWYRVINRVNVNISQQATSSIVKFNQKHKISLVYTRKTNIILKMNEIHMKHYIHSIACAGGERKQNKKFNEQKKAAVLDVRSNNFND